MLFALLACGLPAFAQFGIKAGVNMANEIKLSGRQEILNSFNSSNLTGYQLGVVYQAMPKKSGLGLEIGALLSQKGSAFDDSTGTIKQGYNELNYLEIPLNLRYRLCFGFLGIYGIAGIYGGYALSSHVVDEVLNTTQDETFASFADHLDYGYNLGAGIELFKKIQLGGTWTQGIKSITYSNSILPTPTLATNRVFSVNLVYIF